MFDILGDVITRLNASFSISRLIEALANSTSRISELVRAIKEYSYMDQAPEQEVGVHAAVVGRPVLRFQGRVLTRRTISAL